MTQYDTMTKYIENLSN